MNYKLQTGGGDHFTAVSEKAKRIAEGKRVTVEFDFNGITCLVNNDTNTEWLYRDYCNAHRMEWEVVGPDCLSKYSPEVKRELKRRNKLADERAEQQRKEYEAKEKAEREAFNGKVQGVELELSDVEGWEQSRKANTDGYGAAALDYAEGWAKLMQIEISKGKTVAECYEYTQVGLGFLGITGFQFGCAVGILAQTWKHGEELRKHHNKKYGVSPDQKGTANPAVLTIG